MLCYATLPRYYVICRRTWAFSEPGQEIVPEGAGGSPRPSPCTAFVRVEDEVLRLILRVDGPVHVICHWFPCEHKKKTKQANQSLCLPSKTQLNTSVLLIHTSNLLSPLLTISYCISDAHSGHRTKANNILTNLRVRLKYTAHNLKFQKCEWACASMLPSYVNFKFQDK